MKKPIRIYGLCFAASLLLSGTAGADNPNIKPGLWEMKVENASGGAGAAQGVDMGKAMQKMQAQLAKMPPEQRKMIEAQMGSMGLGMSSSGGIKVCMTNDDIKRQEIPLNDDKNCTTTIKTRTAKRWLANINCSEPPTTGEVEALFESDTSYVVNMKGSRTQNGKAQAYAMSMRWKYLSSDCGTVKPQSEVRNDYLKARQSR